MTILMQRSRWEKDTAHKLGVSSGHPLFQILSLMHEIDPYKAAKAWYELATMKDPPLRCITGTDAFKRMQKKLDDYTANHHRFEKLSNSTDVDGYKAPS
jgi:hypothetical protein